MKLKWEIIWSGGLPHLSGLPHCTWGPPWESAVFYSIRKLDTKSRFPSLTPMWVNNRLSTQKQGFQCSLSFVNWILSCSWSRHTAIFSKLISEPACSLQVDLHWASSHLAWGMQRIGGPFFKNLFMFLERFCQPACFFAARFTLRRSKTPVRNATNLRTFCFSDYHYAFQETLCPVTLAH